MAAQSSVSKIWMWHLLFGLVALARGLGRYVPQAAWHVRQPSTLFLCVDASVEIDLVVAADACCGRLHEKCSYVHTFIHSLSLRV